MYLRIMIMNVSTNIYNSIAKVINKTLLLFLLYEPTIELKRFVDVLNNFCTLKMKCFGTALWLAPPPSLLRAD